MSVVQHSSRKVIRDSGIQTSGHIFHKEVQLLAYADDIDVISRSESGLKEAFQELEFSAKAMGLVINQSKAKYMVVGANIRGLSLRINDYEFEKFQGFPYLGSHVDSGNDSSRDIEKRILSANRGYYLSLIHI